MADTEFFPSPERDYLGDQLGRSDLEKDPILLFDRWLQEAAQKDPLDAISMTLATADAKARPSARIVLLKQADQQGFVFFTNYESRKARELEANPLASLVFYWPHLELQVRVEGSVERVSDRDSDDYFGSRPRGSQIAGSCSPQSTVIESREWLEEAYRRLEEELDGRHPDRPANGGGFRLRPSTLEFWKGRPNRLHDRILYTRLDDDSWKIDRLAP